MNAERDLRTLLSGMRPELNEGVYVFCTVPCGTVPAGTAPVATILEPEGLTLVLRQEDADAAGLAYDYTAGWITLRIHSALDAVGLTAAFATELGAHGLSCNVIAGHHHDHLFVAADRAAEAVAVLEDLAARSGPDRSARGPHPDLS
ncbi:ACT domain-containing protein [Streptomyces sp. NPDC058892]|uniref:ACT domain-containing protein n=1 Tax=unclassified Streptomyces TaxID=2593676 RepID=UPI0036C40366